MKIIKRLIRENVGSDGNLETDKLARALLTYRNTPNKDLGLSPAQLLYGRKLKDHLPMVPEEYKQRKEWILVKEEREQALAHRYGKIEERLKRNTRGLEELEIGTTVQIQNQKGAEPLRWNKSGVIVENRGNDQYSVKMDGSGRVTLRNRQFLRQIKPLFRRSTTYDNDVIEDEPVRRSSRERTVVQRFQAS